MGDTRFLLAEAVEFTGRTFEGKGPCLGSGGGAPLVAPKLGGVAEFKAGGVFKGVDVFNEGGVVDVGSGRAAERMGMVGEVGGRTDRTIGLTLLFGTSDCWGEEPSAFPIFLAACWAW